MPAERGEKKGKGSLKVVKTPGKKKSRGDADGAAVLFPVAKGVF